MKRRTRRLRSNEKIRHLTRETRISSNSLVYPLFVREGRGIIEAIPSLPGQFRYSPDTAETEIEAALKAGVKSFLLFGIPDYKDDHGFGAYDENGVVQETIRRLRTAFGTDICIITDVCLCEYTTHGHCGLIAGNKIDNDSTLPILKSIALSHIRAGGDIVAPSGMMDGTVGAIRDALDKFGYTNTPIMSYAAKYASAFYGPFRDAAGSSPQFGDRKSYQMDFHNAREATNRIQTDIDEGADIIIVKPALSCLDVISNAREQVNVPIATYSVSGEYAMMKAAAAAGYTDEYGIMCESAVSIFRAGADILITYFAVALAEAILKGDIG